MVAVKFVTLTNPKTIGIKKKIQASLFFNDLILQYHYFYYRTKDNHAIDKKLFLGN